jgi:two-component system cell cycle sensor histidine kinase/response regulator CckA
MIDVFDSLAKCGEHLKETPADSEAVKCLAETIFNDASRGIKRARQFLSIANKPERDLVQLSMKEILTNNAALLHSLAGEDVDLQTVIPDRPALVYVDPQEMIQLVSTLVASSRETLPLGGTVLIEVSNIDVDSDVGGHPVGMPSGTYMSIVISADGCSVQPERRTGFIHSIVERMGGFLESSCTPQSGNIHKIYLPRVETFSDAGSHASQASQKW